MIHRYLSAPGCMYCHAPASASGQHCPIAAEVERDYTARHPGNVYDPVQHLRSLVSTLGLVLDRSQPADIGAPVTRFVVRRGEEVVAVAESVVVELAAREAVARIWLWAGANRRA
jgi:hypothetical protein